MHHTTQQDHRDNLPQFSPRRTFTRPPNSRKQTKAKSRVVRLGLERDVKLLFDAGRTYAEMSAILKELTGCNVSISALHRYTQRYLMPGGEELPQKTAQAQELVEHLRDNQNLTFKEIAERLRVKKEQIMICPHCKSKLDKEEIKLYKYLFCPHCGKRLPEPEDDQH